MTKNRRSHKRQSPPCQKRASAGQPRRPKVVVTPPRSPAKLRAKIRIRPAAPSSHQQAILPKPSEGAPKITPDNRGSFFPTNQPDPAHGKVDPLPTPLLPPRQTHLPTSRANLGDRMPVFQPINHQDAELTREDKPEMPSHVTPARGPMSVTALTLVLLATLVACVTTWVLVREHSLLAPHSQEIPQSEKATQILLEQQGILLQAPSTDARRSSEE